MKSKKDIFLVICFLFISVVGCYAEAIKDIKPKSQSAALVNDLLNYRNMYSREGTVIIVGRDIPAIDEKQIYEIGKQQAKEVKKYFLYWLDYWNIRVKTLKFSVYANQNAVQDELVKITIVKSKIKEFNASAYEKINAAVEVLKSKKDVISVTQNNTFLFKLKALFIDANTTDLDYSASFILDSIIDVLKVYGDDVYLKIEIFKKPIFNKHKKYKEIDRFVKVFADMLVKKGIKRKKIFLFSKEDETINQKDLQLYFLKKSATEKEAALFLDRIHVLDKEDLERRKYVQQSQSKESTERKYIYKEGIGSSPSFLPTGWMGDVNDLFIDFSCSDTFYKGKKSIKIVYKATGPKGWAGIQWQYPENNWGNKNESIDLSKYSKLVFFAKGEKGKERIAEFKVGGVKGKYFDSDLAWIGNVKLTLNWQRYEISLKDKKMNSIMGGFAFTITKYDNRYGSTIYLDEIYFE